MTSAASFKSSYGGPHPELFGALPPEQQDELLDIYRLLEKLPQGVDITVGNLKGGVSKTTTTMFLALMLGLSGDSVLVVDCDAVNRSAHLWSMATVDWPKNVRVVTWAGDSTGAQKITGRMMADRVRQVRSQYRHVLIDTGPQLMEYVRGALRETKNFIICSSPYPMDTVQIRPSVDLAAEVESMKPNGAIYCTVLLSRVTKNTRSLITARQDLADKDIACFETAITALQDYAMAPGSVPADFLEYVPVLRELVEDELYALADQNQEKQVNDA